MKIPFNTFTVPGGAGFRVCCGLWTEPLGAGGENEENRAVGGCIQPQALTVSVFGLVASEGRNPSGRSENEKTDAGRV